MLKLRIYLEFSVFFLNFASEISNNAEDNTLNASIMKTNIVVDKQIYPSRREALKTFIEGVKACEGSERERYAYALSQIRRECNVINTYKSIAFRYKSVMDSEQWCKTTGISKDSTCGLHDNKGNFLFVVTDNVCQELRDSGEAESCFLLFDSDSVMVKEIREDYGIFWTDKMDWYSIFRC